MTYETYFIIINKLKEIKNGDDSEHDYWNIGKCQRGHRIKRLGRT